MGRDTEDRLDSRADPPLVYAVGIAAGVILQLIRTRGIPVWDTVWLEDGPVFVEGANAASGPLSTLLESYQGYLQLLPRLLAVPTAWLPIETVPAYLAVAACVTGALAGAFLYRHSDGWVASRPVRLALAAWLVVGPVMAVENTAVITNTIWLGYALVPWALISRVAGRTATLTRAVVVFLAIASTPIVGFYLPLALVVLWRRRRFDDLVVTASFLAGLALQGAVVLTVTSPRTGSASLASALERYGLRAIGSALVGDRPLGSLWIDFGTLAPVGLALVAAALFAFAASGVSPASRRPALLFLSLSLCAFMLPTLLRGTPADTYGHGLYSVSLSRFAVAPIIFLVSAFALVVAPVHDARPPAVAARLSRLMVVQCLAVIVLNLSVHTVRSEGPRWSDEIRAARLHCEIEGASERVRITTTPSNFDVDLDCSRLDP